MDRLVESSSQWRGSITSHIHDALNQSQDEIEFSQRVVVLLLVNLIWRDAISFVREKKIHKDIGGVPLKEFPVSAREL